MSFLLFVLFVIHIQFQCCELQMLAFSVSVFRHIVHVVFTVCIFYHQLSVSVSWTPDASSPLCSGVLLAIVC